MVDFDILRLELRTNKRDMFKMSPVTSSFEVTPEASNLYPKTPFFSESGDLEKDKILKEFCSLFFKTNLVS
jgi:hypothetical protein